VVPENIHALPKDGHWKFQGGGGLKGQNFFKGKYEPKLGFPEGWGGGPKVKTVSGGGMDIFWSHTFS